ncbi:MAG: hypothetical protein SOT66_00365 [Dialister sp.]|nr:hypothetical protein [Dialister sp.]
MWKSQRKWLFLPLACSFWLFAGSTSQAETMYQISETELTQLETNLNQLRKNNETKQQLLTEQKAQLETVQKELTASKSLNAQTLKSLERANQSLTELENEAEWKIRIKTRQRNLWISIAAICATAAIAK